MRALEFVTEALDQPYPFSFKETEYGDVDASTLLPDGTYLNISFNLEENDDGEQTVLVRFDRGGSEEITGAGDAQRVFATVLSAIQEYITDYQPLRINFLATKKVEPKQKSASRFKLYDRMIQRYARAWGYRSFRADNGEAVIYEFNRINKGVAEAKKKKKKKSPRAMGGYFFPGYGYYVGGSEGGGDGGGGVAEGDKMSSINLDQSLANTPPVWKKFISSLPPQLAREFVDERPVPNQEDIDWFTPLRLTNPQPVAVSVADLLRHPENQGSIGRSPDDVIDTVNQQWGLKIPSGKKYDPNPARYRAYAQMTPGTASPSVAVDGVIIFGAGRFVAAALRGDKTMRVWNMTRKQGVAEVLNKTTAQLGPQLYAPHPKNLDESMKPRNALWTSTASGDNNGYTSAWVQWAESEMPQWIGRSGFLYDVSPSARILTINSDQDALIVAKKYGLNTTNVMDLFMYMPWNKIAKDYDAIHHVPSNRGADLFMHAWDVESTAWFNTNMLLNKRKVPIATSKTDLTEGTYWEYVPNEDWLQEKIDYARSRGRNSYGVPHFGSTTASVRGTPFKARVMRLASLPGAQNEENNVRKKSLEWLMDYMGRTGRLPPATKLDPNREHLPYIMVAYNGEAWVSEGNHRIMAAYRLNWQTMPIEINYFDGGERIESGPMYPGKIGLA